MDTLKIKDIAEKCLPVCSFLTQNPEISCQEENSAKFICEFLTQNKYSIAPNFMGVAHSFVATHEDDLNCDKPKIAILCEYDALEDLGHACGHSLSSAISIASALFIRENFVDFPFRVDLIGTPAEEFGGGKIIMTDKGGFDDYEFAVMAHLFNKNIPFFNILASCDMDVTFHGKPAHSSAEPWEGKNALNAVNLFFHAIDMLRQHVTPDCQMHGVITKGGVNPGIVPDETACTFYPRTNSVKTLKTLYDRMSNCAKGCALATETTCEINGFSEIYSDLFTPKSSAEMLRKIFDTHGLVYDIETPVLGSSDVGNISLKIPCFHPGIKIGDCENTKLHTREFEQLLHTDFAIEALQNGIKVLSSICSTLAFDDDLLQKIKAENIAHRSL